MENKPQISEEEAFDLLNDIESGLLPIVEMKEMSSFSIRTWKTGPEYVIGGGWWISIFDDAGDWDYISNITSPDGNRSIDYEDIHQMPKLREWEPSDEALKTIWKW